MSAPRKSTQTTRRAAAAKPAAKTATKRATAKPAAASDEPTREALRVVEGGKSTPKGTRKPAVRNTAAAKPAAKAPAKKATARKPAGKPADTAKSPAKLSTDQIDIPTDPAELTKLIKITRDRRWRASRRGDATLVGLMDTKLDKLTTARDAAKS